MDKKQRLSDIIGDKGKYALVGMNSQGKTYSIAEFCKKHKKTSIYIENETKADAAIKSTTNSSPLIDWLERLLDLKAIRNEINNQISAIDISQIGIGSNISIKLENSVNTFKGMISAKILTESNEWHEPGSGETFFGELLLVEQMISNGNKNPIKYLIIDEPETFLHQSLYIKVCEILRRLSQKMTVIISTHSPEFILSYCDDMKEIIYVQNGSLRRMSEDQHYIDEINNMKVYKENHNNMDSSTKQVMNILHEYFKCYIRPQIIRCLFCNIAVLGEGVAEEVLFECMVKQYANDSVIGDTTFSAIRGKYMMPIYLDILEKIGIKTIAIYDVDKRKTGNPWNDGINKAISEKSTRQYSFDEDIEHFLGIDATKSDRNFKSITSPMSIRLAYLNKDEKLISLMKTIRGLMDFEKGKENLTNSD